MITDTVRKGVFSNYKLSSEPIMRPSFGVAAIICKSDSDSNDTLFTFNSRLEASYQFPANNQCDPMGTALNILFQNGASKVYAYSVSSASKYADAFKLISDLHDVRTVIIDDLSETVTTPFGELLDDLTLSGREAIGFIGAKSPTIETLLNAGNRINSERICIVGTNAKLDTNQTPNCIYLAAFLAAIVASNEDPTVNLHDYLPIGSETWTVSQYTEGLKQQLAQYGITLFENTPSGNNIQLIRALTSKTKNDFGEPCNDFRNLNTTLILDEILSSIRQTLRSRMNNLKNNEVTRSAIASQTTVELHKFLNEGLITSFDIPNVYQDPDDCEICIVEIGFTIVSIINQIHINAAISI